MTATPIAVLVIAVSTPAALIASIACRSARAHGNEDKERGLKQLMMFSLIVLALAMLSLSDAKMEALEEPFAGRENKADAGTVRANWLDRGRVGP